MVLLLALGGVAVAIYVWHWKAVFATVTLLAFFVITMELRFPGAGTTRAKAARLIQEFLDGTMDYEELDDLLNGPLANPNDELLQDARFRFAEIIRDGELLATDLDESQRQELRHHIKRLLGIETASPEDRRSYPWHCPRCGERYYPDHYRTDVTVIYCSVCKSPLPR